MAEYHNPLVQSDQSINLSNNSNIKASQMRRIGRTLPREAMKEKKMKMASMNMKMNMKMVV